MERKFQLDVVGVIEGTNKSSSFHASMDFLRHYERLFHEFRDQPINFIEIGLDKGNSLAVWKWCFPRARIVGVDINPKCASYADERVSIEIGSQDDPEFLRRVCEKFPPSIIVDDGSHRADHIMCSFENMFPSLLPGGLYVIEDLAIHFNPASAAFKGNAKEWTTDYFLTVARSCVARAPRDAPADESMRATLEGADSVEFLRSALVVQKKAAPVDMAAALRFADDYLGGRGPNAGVHERLAQFIVRHDGPLDRAESELARAIELDGENPQRLRIYSDIRFRQRRLPEAVAFAERAANTGNDPYLWVRVGDLRTQRGEHGGAESAFRKAIELRPGDEVLLARLNASLKRQGKAALAPLSQG